jgi:hypothetical protein
MPDSGHLLLSASADSKIAIWDVYHQRELLRTYSGHTKSVNDIDFNPSGTQFISASYDRFMKIWDTETGKCLNKFTTGKTPHVIRINPSTPHEFLAGMADKKILQYDTRSGEIVQEYDHHLGPVNTITYCDEVCHFSGTIDSYLTSFRTAVLSRPRTTSLSAPGSMVFRCQLNSSQNRTCSQWSAQHHIRPENTLRSSPPIIKSRCTHQQIVSGRTARRVTEAIMLPDTRQTWRSVQMANSSAQVIAVVTCVSGTGRLARCGTRSKQVTRLYWPSSGILERPPRSLPVTSTVCSNIGIRLGQMIKIELTSLLAIVTEMIPVAIRSHSFTDAWFHSCNRSATQVAQLGKTPLPRP